MPAVEQFPSEQEMRTRTLVAERARVALESGRLDDGLNGLEDLHGRLFKGLVPWAGKMNGGSAQVVAARSLAHLREAENGSDRTKVIHGIAKFMAETERQPIFPSGNRHVMAAAASIVAKRAGLHIGWSGARIEELSRDVRLDVHARTEQIEKTLLRITRTYEPNQEPVERQELQNDKTEAVRVAERRMLDDKNIKLVREVPFVSGRPGTIASISKHYLVQAVGNEGDYCTIRRGIMTMTARLGEEASISIKNGRAYIQAIREPEHKPAIMSRSR